MTPCGTMIWNPPYLQATTLLWLVKALYRTVEANLELEYYDSMGGMESEEKFDMIDPYDYSSTRLFARLRAKEPFCSFFDNRSPQVQPDLRNCTWYRDYSCCRQAELESIFKKIKPLQGATDSCIRQLNYMLCWVCDPLQHNFYRNGWHRLRICKTFCDTVLDACSSARLKGDYVGVLYADGVEFCKSRRFDVALNDKDCFTYSGGKSQRQIAKDQRGTGIKASYITIRSFLWAFFLWFLL